MFVIALADPSRKFSYKQFAQKFGIQSNVLRRWAKEPTLAEQVRDKAIELLGGPEVITEVFRSLVRYAKLGSFKHQKLLLELTHLYTPGVDVRVGPPIESAFQDLERKNAGQLKLIGAAKTR